MKRVFNNNIMLIFVLLIILFFSILFGFKAVYANESVEYEKSFISIEIKQGDSLTSIASDYALSPSEYDEYISEVKQINNLKEDTIHAGCYLMIPIYTDYYGAAEPPVRCGVSHLSGLTEPLH